MTDSLSPAFPEAPHGAVPAAHSPVIIKPSYDDRLCNEDLAPLRAQTWTSYNIFAFWMSDVHSVGGYVTASSLFSLGLVSWQVLISLLVGILIVQFFVNLVAKPSQVTGTPYPVFCRAVARFGASYIASRAAATIAGHAALDALAAHVAGCDAVYLACFGDPGLPALQKVSPVPVVGMAEAACREAARSGRRFSIVTGRAVWRAMLREYVTSLGLAHQLASIRIIEPTGDQIAQNPEAAFAALASACAACATEDGAQIVILGGAALAGLASRLQHQVPVPILRSVEVGTRTATEAARRRTQIREERVRTKAQASIGLSDALETLLSQSRTG